MAERLKQVMHKNARKARPTCTAFEKKKKQQSIVIEIPDGDDADDDDAVDIVYVHHPAGILSIESAYSFFD